MLAFSDNSPSICDLFHFVSSFFFFPKQRKESGKALENVATFAAYFLDDTGTKYLSLIPFVSGSS